ncbi:MAG: murein L,D-transpeptidase [Beijerinckiaceae bacterium]
MPISRFARVLAPGAIIFASLTLPSGPSLAQGLMSPQPMGAPQRMVRPAAPPAAQAPAVQAPAARSAPPAAWPPGQQATQAEPSPQPVKKRKPRRKAAAKGSGNNNVGGGWAIRTDAVPNLQPETFYATAKAAERYAAIADAGGWPKITKPLQPGASGPAVAALRKRLSLEGDLPASAADSTRWDAELTKAVRNFQYRVGLRQNGVVSGKTLTAINIPAALRFRQLASSAHRIAGSNFSFGNRYVVVNIPSASVEAVENGRVVRRYVAVVGDVKHRSPQVITRITHVNLNPTWTVPTSIIKNEIIPRMRRDPGYLSRSKIRILDGRGKEINASSINWSTERAANYTLRQDSGTHNALGSIRIQMPNSESVYMHDTPSKRFFARDYRFLSHGCVRVKDVYDLAEWLLRGAPGAMSKQAMIKQIGNKRRDVRLAAPVPVAWIYMTGWASSDGVVHFREDIYNVDRIGGGRTASAR